MFPRTPVNENYLTNQNIALELTNKKCVTLVDRNIAWLESKKCSEGQFGFLGKLGHFFHLLRPKLGHLGHLGQLGHNLQFRMFRLAGSPKPLKPAG